VKKLKKICTFVLMFFLIFLCACTKKVKYVRYSANLVGAFETINRVDFWTTKSLTDNEKTTIINELNQTLMDLDNKFNVIDRKNGVVTDLMKINQNAGIAPVKVDDEVIYVLKLALEIARQTEVDGVALYDITIAPIWQLWDFANNIYVPLMDNRIEIPKKEKIESLLPLVNYKNIIINEDDKTVFLKEKGMAIDLGSIVKGYAADKLRQVFEKYGITKAVIDVGRNILVLGSYFDNDDNTIDIPFTASIVTPYVNIFDPEYDKVAYIGELKIAYQTIVTSGTYEKYVRDFDGNYYHHILDPRTGYPFDNGVVSISVITNESIKGDAYSTALFSLGLDTGMKLVNENPNIDAVWVVKNNDVYEVYISKGLENNFVFNQNLIARNYVYKGVYQ